MAEFICNKEFLNEFYRHLQFENANIIEIDMETSCLKNLRVLNLFKNRIETISNIPSSCLELYLDFNLIDTI